MKHVRLLGAGTAVLLGIAGLTGCGSGNGGSGSSHTSAAGGGSGSGSGKAPVVDVSQALGLVAQSTKSAKSAKVDMVEKVGSVATITASGSMAWAPMQMDMTMKMSGVKDAEAAQIGAQGISMRMIGTVMYMNMGSKLAQELGGKHWMKMDLAALAKQQGNAALQQMTQQLGQGQGQDPSQSVALMASSGDVKAVGKETVNGVETTHYSGTLDVAKVAEKQAPGMTATQRKQFEQQMSAAGVKTMHLDLWADSGNLPIKVHESAATNQGPLDIVLNYSHYGTPVHIQPPAASDTFDMAQMFKGLPKS